MNDIENLIKKFENIMNENDSYQFYLKTKILLPKFVKKNSEEKIFVFLNFVISHLISVNDNESALNLLELSLSLFEKYHSNINEKENFVKNYHNLYKKFPIKNCDKSRFKINFLIFCEKNKINENLFEKEKIFYDFANDAIENFHYIMGYRFAMKIKNIEFLEKEIEYLKKDELFKISEIEIFYFISRACLEFLINKDTKIANDFIVKFIDKDLNKNHPILNFAFLLVKLLEIKEISFENFKKFVDFYQKFIDKDKKLKLYLDQISKNYFQKNLYFNNPFANFNFFNMIRMFSGGNS